MLQSALVDLHLPVLGDVHLVTSVFFDVGVYLVVVGLVLDLLRSLGSGIDRHIRDEESERAGTRGDRRERQPVVLILAAAAADRVRCLPVLERSLTRVLVGLVMLGNGVNLLFLISGGPAGRAPIVGRATGRR